MGEIVTLAQKKKVGEDDNTVAQKDEQVLNEIMESELTEQFGHGATPLFPQKNSTKKTWREKKGETNSPSLQKWNQERNWR